MGPAAHGSLSQGKRGLISKLPLQESTSCRKRAWLDQEVTQGVARCRRGYLLSDTLEDELLPPSLTRRHVSDQPRAT